MSTRKLIEKARQWPRKADSTWPKRVADKGHFVVYTADERRFMIPLSYLKSDVFRELFRMAEEEFGMPSDGPITLPCNSGFMEYAIDIIRKTHSFSS